MIALPVDSCTRRFQGCQEISWLLCRAYKGLVPNMFTDGEEPLYNTVDASLWFIYAVQKYFSLYQGYAFVKNHLWKTMQEIICCYRMEPDTVLEWSKTVFNQGWFSGAATDLDGCQGRDWVVTHARKPVEINALWYNALDAMSQLARYE